jgi:eukaryotic-like serine/threonine-protein kinase
MKMGESLQRSRKSGGSTPGASKRTWSVQNLTAGGWRYPLRLLGLGALGLGFGYLVATRVVFPVPKPPSDLVTVPAVEGVTVAEAETRMADAGLVLGTVEGIRHPTLDSGVVVGQGPIGGQLLKRGGEVRLTISLGPQRQAVPDVMRLLGDRAVRVLESTGFQVTVDSVESDLPAGSIVTVDPAAGTMLQVPAEVRVTVSRGPTRFPMPYLLGMPGQLAVDSLTFLGFAPPQVDTVFRFGRDQGMVVEQDPAADSLVARGSRVRLTVGRPGG